MFGGINRLSTSDTAMRSQQHFVGLALGRAIARRAFDTHDPDAGITRAPLRTGWPRRSTFAGRTGRTGLPWPPRSLGPADKAHRCRSRGRGRHLRRVAPKKHKAKRDNEADQAEDPEPAEKP